MRLKMLVAIQLTAIFLCHLAFISLLRNVNEKEDVVGAFYLEPASHCSSIFSVCFKYSIILPT